ncbi:MAG: VanZ like family protein [Syntrophorhabdaceae bacterium PtaU1.Bin034]|nr:MAG: VanZ like family protein [Syntrophorhabdaceae bacterium PtaU1.Bin034]
MAVAYLNNGGFRIFRLVIGFQLVLLVIVASLMPHPPHTAYFKGSDKVAHFAAYMTMTFWFAWTFPVRSVRLKIGAVFLILGAILECLQWLSGYRTFEYADMAANGLGVLCALTLTQVSLLSQVRKAKMAGRRF